MIMDMSDTIISLLYITIKIFLSAEVVLSFYLHINNMCTLFCNVQVAYMILLVVFSQLEDSKHKHCDKDHQHNPDHLVAYFCIGHAALWLCITVLDRIIQWRHQIIRKRGYLTFYRKMRNIRRVPFVLVSTSEQ